MREAGMWDDCAKSNSSSVFIRGNCADARQAVEKVEELIGPKWTQVPVWTEPLTDVTQ